MVSSANATLLLAACVASLASNTSSFSPTINTNHHAAATTTQSQTSTSLSMAGFGAASSKKQKKKKGALPKLKAKAQWDRYNDLKGAKNVTVGVRIVKGSDDDDATTNEWMDVGRVRSETNEYEVAVARQRALIAEHSKRLHIVKIPENAVLEWGYVSSSGEEDGEEQWTVVDKSKGDDAPKGIEKKIGFEGISDAATGFYCYYHEGRVIEKTEQPKGGAGAAFKNVKGK